MDSHACRELARAFCLIFDFRHREIERSERSGLDPGQFAMDRSDQELPLIRLRDRAQSSSETVFETPGASPGRCDDGIHDPSPPRCSDSMETHLRCRSHLGRCVRRRSQQRFENRRMRSPSQARQAERASPHSHVARRRDLLQLWSLKSLVCVLNSALVTF